MKIYDRAKGNYLQQNQYGEGALRFLYGTAPGRLFLKVVTGPAVSRLAALYYRHPISRRKMETFIRRYEIDMGEYEERVYRNFDEFFTRKKLPEKINILEGENRLISPADSRLIAYEISEDRLFRIKHSLYSVESLLGDSGLAASYEGGMALVFRLGVEDYHRYAFVEDGEILHHRRIPGRLHTVSSFSKDYPVFVENKREYILIRSLRGGDIVQMEVGALLVGRIENHQASRAVRGAEKGYFRFGGSTIILLFEKNRVCIDRDIRKMSAEGIETKLRYGEGIGDWLC